MATPNKDEEKVVKLPTDIERYEKAYLEQLSEEERAFFEHQRKIFRDNEKTKIAVDTVLHRGTVVANARENNEMLHKYSMFILAGLSLGITLGYLGMTWTYRSFKRHADAEIHELDEEFYKFYEEIDEFGSDNK